MQLSAENQKLLNVTPAEMRERARRRSKMWFGKPKPRSEPPQETKPHTAPLVALSDDEYVAQFVAQTPIIRSMNSISNMRLNKVKLVQRTVAIHFGISMIDMFSQRRNQRVTYPRQIAMYLCKEHTIHSLPEIGRRFGGRDHTTVLHACQKIRRLCETEKTKTELAAIERELA